MSAIRRTVAIQSERLLVLRNDRWASWQSVQYCRKVAAPESERIGVWTESSPLACAIKTYVQSETATAACVNLEPVIVTTTLLVVGVFIGYNDIQDILSISQQAQQAANDADGDGDGH